LSNLGYRVNSSRVPIYLGDSLSELSSWLRTAPRAAAVIDSRIAELYPDLVRELNSTNGAVISTFVAAEENKNLEQTTHMLDYFLRNGIRRDSILFAVGGGITGDLAGFVAAIFQRGISYVQVPTTLLAMVDSSIGGKVGVNNSLGKNMVGSFYQPSAIIMDTRFIDTLPRDELLCGLGEVVKYAVLSGERFADFLEANHARILNREHRSLQRIIRMAVETKKRYVERDVRELGIRAHLNLGHTIGHAVEAATNFSVFKHGEAILIGLVAEAHIAMHMKLLRPSAFERILEMVRSVAKQRSEPVPLLELTHRLSYDKKVKSGKIRFVLPVGIGRVIIRDDVPIKEINESMKFVEAEGLLSLV